MTAPVRQPLHADDLQPVRPLSIQPGIKCKRCGSNTFERIPRFGFWQENILPFFELYPWRCVRCSKVTYRSQRAIEDMGRR